MDTPPDRAGEEQSRSDRYLGVMRTVTVTGSGTSKIAPDSAVVRVAVVGRGVGVVEAYDIMSLGAAQLAGVAARHTDKRHLASTGVSVWPFHDHEGRREGYEARHGYAVRLTDLAAAGVMLSDLAREVGDSLAVENVGLEVTDTHAAESKAREAAFHDARERAAALARMSGLSLGGVQSMVEGGAGSGIVPESARMAMMHDAGGALEPGETSVTSTVTVVWELT